VAYKPGICGTLHGGSHLKAEYDVDVAETFDEGALVYYDTSENNIKVCGADPSAVLGFAGHHHDAGVDSTKVLVHILTPDSIVRIKGSSNPTDQSTQFDAGYGVTIAATTGIPTLDLTETTTKQFKVIGVDLKTLEYICIPIPAVLQYGAVAS
jgi:hypothetical protein